MPQYNQALKICFVTVALSGFGASAKPVSLDDRVRTVAKAAMQNADVDGLNYEGVQRSDDQDDSGRANGKVVMMLNYHLASLPSFDGDAAKFSASLFQKVFALHPSIVYVWIKFNGPVKDRYGQTDETNYIGYALNRSTFAKINWSGFDSERLCAFLREEQNEEDSCMLWPEISSKDVEPPRRHTD